MGSETAASTTVPSGSAKQTPIRSMPRASSGGTHEEQVIRRIDSVLSVHETLSHYSESMTVTVEGSRIVVRGCLPSVALKQAIVPAIRQAGVLEQVCNCVEIG